MAKGFKHGGGGGSSLNFKVIGNPKPAEPAENTVWIDSDTPISEWMFGTTQPENAPEGMLWIALGGSSPAPFNAIKKNTLNVYPLTARQYISGEWVPVIAELYQGGVWIPFSGGRKYLFRSGDGAVVTLKAYSESSASITIGTDKISTTASSSTECYADCRTSEKIDLSLYSTMYLTYTASGRKYADGCEVGVTTSAFSNPDMSHVTLQASTALANSSTSKTVAVDLSEIGEAMYCCFGFCGKLNVTEWWLE